MNVVSANNAFTKWYASPSNSSHTVCSLPVHQPEQMWQSKAATANVARNGCHGYFWLRLLSYIDRHIGYDWVSARPTNDSPHFCIAPAFDGDEPTVSDQTF